MSFGKRKGGVATSPAPRPAAPKQTAAPSAAPAKSEPSKAAAPPPAKTTPAQVKPPPVATPPKAQVDNQSAAYYETKTTIFNRSQSRNRCLTISVMMFWVMARLSHCWRAMTLRILWSTVLTQPISRLMVRLSGPIFGSATTPS